ncbi:5-methylcytosine restriction system specificity protein McrC [Jeotgalibacillus soli]|uniref:5-methylcytosine restriction system specificity protein McrC n=1 Tax=Jeotgalibacillus soli TaxID=889306 RepID=UPI000597DC28|nr:hypothetical protein [Jeotgalibacillus soli]
MGKNLRKFWIEERSGSTLEDYVLREAEILHSRGFVKNYIEKQEVTNRLGGRIMINESIPYLISKKPLLNCEKDEYSFDILLNQVMKVTLQSIC